MTGIVLRRSSGSLGLMGHLIADYPSPAAARDIIAVMVAAGVDCIEIQIPFSEPVADGPLFLAANHRALDQGVTTDRAFALMQESTVAHPGTQFLFMSYLNPIYKRGYDTFCRDAAAAGARALIVPDLPLECASPLETACRKYGLNKVQLIAPNATPERLERLASSAEGLIYAVARAGVTGADTSFGEGLGRFLGAIKRHTQVPIALGFGVKDADDIAFLKGKADLAVVGSQAMRVFDAQGLEGLAVFWKALKEACHDKIT